MAHAISLSAISHPEFHADSHRWHEYRLTFQGGDAYMDQYLIQQADETVNERKERKLNTPIPAVAKAAVEDVIRAITQRLADVTRIGGSPHYQSVVEGEGSGIDREGQSMNEFISQKVLQDMLVMGRVGVYVDNIPPDGPTMASGPAKPYAYAYPVEDILNWETVRPEQPGRFSMILLRDRELSFSQAFGISFPNKFTERLRLVWLGGDGFVRYRFMTNKLEPVMATLNHPQLVMEDDGAIRTLLREVPFVMPSIQSSLLTDVASYQRLAMNIASNEGMFGINVNSPMLTIQKDVRADAQYWKKMGEEEPGGQRATNASEKQGIRSGWVRGRYYGPDDERPGWINMPVDSLKVSSDYRLKLADEVRQLVNVAVQNQTGIRTESRETREISAQGLESGLYFLAMKMQNTERQIAKFIAFYEGRDSAAVVTYPKRFSLKSQAERIKDAKDFKEVINDLPTQEAKKEGIKKLVLDLYTAIISSDTMTRLLNAIDNHPYIGDFDNIMKMVETGLITRELAGGSQDLKPEEVETATEEKIKAAAAILEAQAKAKEDATPDRPARPAARGVPEVDANPQSGKEERAEDERKRGKQQSSTKGDKE